MLHASRAALLSLLVVALSATHAAADWRICDEGVFTVTGGEAEPAVAHAGQDIAFRVHGFLDRNVSAGLLEVWVSYLGFNVYSKSGDLCEAVPCPLAQGQQTLEFKQSLPRSAPSGPYMGCFQATASTGERLFCVNLNFRVALKETGTAKGAAALQEAETLREAVPLKGAPDTAAAQAQRSEQ